mgnify:CR=1 FL=1
MAKGGNEVEGEIIMRITARFLKIIIIILALTVKENLNEKIPL